MHKEFYHDFFAVFYTSCLTCLFFPQKPNGIRVFFTWIVWKYRKWYRKKTPASQSRIWFVSEIVNRTSIWFFSNLDWKNWYAFEILNAIRYFKHDSYNTFTWYSIISIIHIRIYRGIQGDCCKHGKIDKAILNIPRKHAVFLQFTANTRQNPGNLR